MKLLCLLVAGAVLFMSTGCTIILQKGRLSDIEKISELSQQIDELSRARMSLEDQLREEIAAEEVSLSMEERGLVVTFVSEVLFDSGKAQLRKESFAALDKVADILQEEASSMQISVEGHTDNQPIKHSRWNSNWQLSTERALGVLTYLISGGLSPERLSATGYGEFHPRASNDTKKNRQINRRVEIVISPRKIAQEATTLLEKKEDFK